MWEFGPQSVAFFQLLRDDGIAIFFQDITERKQAEEAPRIHISAAKEDRHWRFAVRDNGIGIDPKQAGKLFQVFQRASGREYEGTGIGLAICKRIVEQHGGRVWVDSRPGEGSVFYFTISDIEGGGGKKR